MVTVFVWNYRGKSEAWGHASMLVNGGTPGGSVYVSWWPEGQGREGSLPFGIGDGYLYSVPAINGRTFNDDVQGEDGHHPDHTINLEGLDETEIKTWWNKLLNDTQSRWSTLGQNCSTTVARGLMAGGGDKLVKGIGGWWKSWNTVWKPNDVLDYAQAIHDGYSKQ